MVRKRKIVTTTSP